MSPSDLMAFLSDGTWRVLLDIPRWRWAWEGSYVSREPVVISAGQPIRLGCTFDNGTSNQWSQAANEPDHDRPATGPLQEPRYIVAGSERAAEMCTAIVDVITYK